MGEPGRDVCMLDVASRSRECCFFWCVRTGLLILRPQYHFKRVLFFVVFFAFMHIFSFFYFYFQYLCVSVGGWNEATHRDIIIAKENSINNW